MNLKIKKTISKLPSQKIMKTKGDSVMDLTRVKSSGPKKKFKNLRGGTRRQLKSIEQRQLDLSLWEQDQTLAICKCVQQ